MLSLISIADAGEEVAGVVPHVPLVLVLPFEQLWSVQTGDFYVQAEGGALIDRRLNLCILL